MINRASNAVNLVWTPKVSFTGWRENVGTYTDNDFVANVQVTGLPYARPGHYWDINLFYPTYVGIENYGDGTASTLSNFQTRIANINDAFNVAASTTNPNIQHGGYGPLYGLECSRFVCYAWGYGSSIDHSTTGYDSDPYCYKVISKANGGSFTSSDLALLLPGDALVRYNSHAILVTAIYKNASGAVTKVEVMEEVNPKARRVVYGTSSNPLSNLLNRLVSNSAGKPYQAYRFKETVSFNANLGTVSPLSIPIITNKTYGFFNNGVLPTPVCENYAFVGWFTKKTGGTQVTANTLVENDSARTLYAHWVVVPPIRNAHVVGRDCASRNETHIGEIPYSTSSIAISRTAY